MVYIIIVDCSYKQHYKAVIKPGMLLTQLNKYTEINTFQ